MHTNCSRRPNFSDCDARQSSSIRNGADNRRLLGVRQDWLRSSWVVSRLSFQPICHTKEINWKTVLTEIQDFMRGRPKQHVILGGDFNASLHGMADPFHVGESIPRPRTVDTNDSLRARAVHTMVTELDLTVTNTWMNADTEQELFTRSSWSNPADSLTQMDFITTSRKLEMKHVQVLDSDWFKTDHRAVLAVLSIKTENEIHKEEWSELAWLGARRLLVQSGCRDAAGVGELGCDGAFAYGNGEDTQESGREIWRKRKALKREMHLGKIKESAGMEKAVKKTQSKHFNWRSLSKQENPESVLTNFFHNLCSIPGDQEEASRSERRHWVELWKNLRMDCAEGMLISPKKLQKSLEEVAKRERFTGSDHGRCFESIASRTFGEIDEIAVVDVLGYDFPGRLAVLFDGNGSESGGCNVLDQVQANRCAVCDAESLGLHMAQVTPPLKYESVPTAFVPKTHADAGLFLLLQAAELSREWQKEVVVVQLDVKKAFDHVAVFKAMKLQGLSLFSMLQSGMEVV